MSSLHGFTRDSVVALSAALAEPDWLLAKRLEAFTAFEQTPYPDTRSDEDWRRCDLRRIDFDALADIATPNGATASAVTAADDAVGTATFVDGTLVGSRLNAELAAQGVVLTSLHQALPSHGELIRTHFMTHCVQPGEGKFTLLHAAFFNQGLFCYVPRGVQVDGALLAQVELGGGSLLHHSLIIVDDGARLSLVEEYRSAADVTGLSVPITEIIAGRDAQVVYAGVQEWGPKVYEVGVKRVLAGPGAQVSLCTGNLGGKLSKEFIGAALAGSGSSVDLLGISFPAAGQHLDQTTVQDHRVANCHSNLRFLGAVGDKGRSVFRGVISVHPEAQQTDAYQKNENLLLGDKARADSMPVLEILADDVKCSHGASLSHLDNEIVFYLMSRGLPRGEAQRMMVAGFFEPVIEQVPVESVRARLQHAVAQRIDNLAASHGGLL
ncbi:MAG: Fe-S cluster assembly protein SufD [Armatimonadetes bacterium]|nr:Fe-S cluster assembly protein SufD [Armatimonadota bacterium]